MATRHTWLMLAALAVSAWSSTAIAQSNIHLYILDTHTGAVTQATPPMDFEPYNASFCNDGKELVHDIVPGNLLAVTDLKAGVVTNLGIEGENAHWSPNGKYIAYHYWVTTPHQLRVIPAAGGAPVFTRDWAYDPSWSNNSKRIAFMDGLGYIGTVGLDGTETNLGYMAWGCNPAYSPDGKLIVYEGDGCWWGYPAQLMAIPVNENGVALGDPYPITSGAFYASYASFSNDGKTIVFSGNAGSDPTEWGLYTVSVYGGDPVVLFDRPGKGEWDPAYSNNGRYVVFSGPE